MSNFSPLSFQVTSSESQQQQSHDKSSQQQHKDDTLSAAASEAWGVVIDKHDNNNNSGSLLSAPPSNNNNNKLAAGSILNEGASEFIPHHSDSNNNNNIVTNSSNLSQGSGPTSSVPRTIVPPGANTPNPLIINMNNNHNPPAIAPTPSASGRPVIIFQDGNTKASPFLTVDAMLPSGHMQSFCLVPTHSLTDSQKHTAEAVANALANASKNKGSTGGVLPQVPGPNAMLPRTTSGSASNGSGGKSSVVTGGFAVSASTNPQQQQQMQFAIASQQQQQLYGQQPQMMGHQFHAHAQVAHVGHAPLPQQQQQYVTALGPNGQPMQFLVATGGSNMGPSGYGTPSTVGHSFATGSNGSSNAASSQQQHLPPGARILTPQEAQAAGFLPASATHPHLFAQQQQQFQMQQHAINQQQAQQQQQQGLSSSSQVSSSHNTNNSRTALTQVDPATGEKKKVGIDYRRFKSRLCVTYQTTGECSWGEMCAFAHGLHEICPSSATGQQQQGGGMQQSGSY
jgi:hypothetical protein